MHQPSLLADVERKQRPWKRTTETSRAAVKTFEATGTAESLRKHCTRAIRRIWNRTQQSPRAEDIARDLARLKVIPDAHPDHVKPRLTELRLGYWVWRKVNGAKVKVHVGGGLIEIAGKRKSDRSGVMVNTYRVIERGTGH